jgi:hypothetical protein
MILTPPAIYQFARQAGFPPVVAVTMTAIALRESAGNPDAYNGNIETGDNSFGLWQINLKDPSVRSLINAKLLAPANASPSALFDPLTNARAAFLLWGGNNKNLSIAWYIDRGGDYQMRYESHLPAAQAAALASPG